MLSNKYGKEMQFKEQRKFFISFSLSLVFQTFFSDGGSSTMARILELKTINVSVAKFLSSKVCKFFKEW